MLARPLVHNAPFPATFSALALAGAFDSPTFIGASYSDSLIISGGSGTYSNPRFVSGAGIDGLTLSVIADTLDLSGTVSGDPGTFHFIFIAAVDDVSNGWTTFIESTIVVYDALVINGLFADGSVGVPYSSDLTIAGGDGVYSNPARIGAIPNGLSLSLVAPNLLRLSGTPTLPVVAAFAVACDSGDGQSATSDPQTVTIT